MIIVDVFVAGNAKTKGSMEVRNRTTGAMKESVIGSSNWRALMAAAVRDDIARRNCTAGSAPCEHPRNMECGRVPPYPGAVAVTVVAYLTPPRSTRPDGAPGWHDAIWPRAGDLDKLVRNVLDALGSASKNPKMNGGAIVDDNLVCRINAEKRSADGLRAGVQIKVETL